MQETEQRMRRLIADHLGIAEDLVTPEARFVEDLGADSLDGIELVMMIEEEFGLDITDADAEGLSTFGAALRYVADHSIARLP